MARLADALSAAYNEAGGISNVALHDALVKHLQPLLQTNGKLQLVPKGEAFEVLEDAKQFLVTELGSEVQVAVVAVSGDNIKTRWYTTCPAPNGKLLLGMEVVKQDILSKVPRR